MQFSVIIPLEFHRGQGTKCIEAWCRGQEFPGDGFEVLCVMPQAYPAKERAAIEQVLRPHDRLIESDGAHDMAMCVEGAALATGDALFFTESHVWPEPNVLKASASILESNPDWTAFSCKTTRVASNLLAEVEADMYETEIDYGMNEHAWRKILDQCFVTRREGYFRAGGFDARLGHFAEWTLAERYYKNGFKIGYAPEVRLHHYYIGQVGELTTFTADFVDGETLYFSELPSWERTLMVPPTEWGNLDRTRARHLVKMLYRYAAGHWPAAQGPGTLSALYQLVRYLPAATKTTGVLRLAAMLRRLWCRLKLGIAELRRSKTALAQSFQPYIEALIHERRLRQIPRLLDDTARRPCPETTDFTRPESASTITGFHPVETFDGKDFRWSEPAALAAVKVPAGRLRLRLSCLKVPRRLTDTLVFFFDGKLVPQGHVKIRKDEVELLVKSPKAGVSILLWMCKPLINAESDLRCGLPVIRLDVEQRAEKD